MIKQKTKEAKSENGRMLHYDLLRILACFSVVMLHSAAQFWYSIPVTELEWMITNSYDAAFRFGVPIFVMISGVLFLNTDKEINLMRLYIHNILRMVILFLVWSVLYGLFDCRKYPKGVVEPKVVLQEILMSRYHLWFLQMISGIYILLPVLKKWISNASKKNIEYFLMLFMVFQVGRETILAFVERPVVNFLVNTVNIYMVCGYLGYFVLGYYIVRYGIDIKWHKWIYIGGILSVVGNIVCSNAYALRVGEPNGEIFDSFSIFTFMISLALFLVFTDKVSRVRFSKGAEKIIKEMSLATLGIYLMHLAFIEFFEPLGFHSMIIPIGVGVPFLAVVCFGICFVISAVVRRIPFIGKYLC